MVKSYELDKILVLCCTWGIKIVDFKPNYLYTFRTNLLFSSHIFVIICLVSVNIYLIFLSLKIMMDLFVGKLLKLTKLLEVLKN